MDEPKTISKRAYWGLKFALTVVIGLMAVIVVHVQARSWGLRIRPSTRFFFDSLSLVLARVVAERILRRFGLVSPEKPVVAVAVHGRSPFRSYDVPPMVDAVEARLPLETISFVFVGMPMMAVLFFTFAWVLKKDPLMWWVCMGMGGFFMVCLIENILDYGKPIARVDADGVTGYPSHRALWRRFVPWSDVFSCEVQTVYGRSGKPALLRPILKGRHGETLMTLYLNFTPMKEQERVVAFIKSRLPEMELDPSLS